MQPKMDVNGQNSKENIVSNLKKQSKFSIRKNLSTLSVAIMLLLSAKLPSGELQSSINIKDGLGTYTGTVSGIVSMLSTLTLPNILIKKVGLKRAMIFSLIIGNLKMLGNFKPTWAVMIPTSIISSIAGSSLWPAKASYLSVLADQWSNAFETKIEPTTSVIFGFFYSFYYFGYIWGNFAVYYILRPKTDSSQLHSNISAFCGLPFCDKDALDGQNQNFVRPPDSKIYLLFGLFVAMTWLAALVLALFLDDKKNENDTSQISLCSLSYKTLLSIVKPKHLILLPLSLIRGVSNSFLSTEYTKAFVTCSWGVHNISVIMISFGVTCGIMSLILGRIVRYTGRVPLFVTALIFHVAVAVVVITWKPTPTDVYMYFPVPVFLGVCNAVWESQVAALYAIMFPGERDVAFAIYDIAEGAGGSIASGYSAALCTPYKLLIYMLLVFIAFTCFLVTEFKYLRHDKIFEINSKKMRFVNKDNSTQ